LHKFPPRPPANLHPQAKLLWRRLIEEHGVEDAGGLALVAAAAESLDRAKRVREQIEKDGLTIRDRFGQTRAHPLLAAERDARAGLVSALKALNLAVEPLNSQPGRPSGSGNKTAGLLAPPAQIRSVG
jgi:phage terminase small subunit